MPALQFSAAVLSGLLNGNQADVSGKATDALGKKSGTDQFSSLLDVVGNISDSNSPADISNKKDDAKDPVATVVDAPVIFRDPVRRDNKQAGGQVDDRDADKRVVAQDQGNKSQDDSFTQSEHLTARSPVNSQGNINRSAPSADNNNNSSDKIGDVVGEDDTKVENSAHVDNLSSLLEIISQLLAGAANITVANGSQDQVGNNGNGTVSSLSGDGQKVADPLVVFADLKDVLSKLKDILQAAITQNSPLSDAQLAALSDINTALKTDLDALKNLFPQGVQADGQDSLLAQITQTTNTQDVSGDQQQTVSDLKSLLDNDVKLISDTLQKFRDKSAALVSKAAEVITAQLGQQPTVSDQANNILQHSQREGVRSEAFVFTTVVAAAAAEQVNNPQPQLQDSQTLLPAAVTVQAASGTEADTSSGNSSGQGSNSGAQFAIGSINQLGVKSADSAGGAQFSSLLNRTVATPVTEQVAFQIKTAVGNGNSKITIQLHPEDLGKLDITLDVDSKGKTGVTITADNKQTLDMLQRDSQGLQKALADAGLKADSGSLNFNLRGGEQQGQGQNQSQAASQYKKSQPDELQPDEVNMAAVASVTRSYVINLPDGLNIKI